MSYCDNNQNTGLHNFVKTDEDHKFEWLQCTACEQWLAREKSW